MAKYGIKIKAILKCDGKFLLVKRWYDDRIDNPYQWEFLDTEIIDGETPEVSCLEYVQQSTGIYAEIEKMAYSWVYTLGDNRHLGLAFLCNVSDEIVILSEELNDYKWVEADEIKDYIDNKAMLNDMHQAGVI